MASLLHVPRISGFQWIGTFQWICTRTWCQRALDALFGFLFLFLGGVCSGLIRKMRSVPNGTSNRHANADLQTMLASARSMPLHTPLTNVSKAPLLLATRSSSNPITPGSNKSRIVEPPNLKYPSSSARFTLSPFLRVMTVEPTIMAPTQMTMTFP